MNERREKIHIEHPLPKARRCKLLEVSRSTAYYQPRPVSDTTLMRRMGITASRLSEAAEHHERSS